MANILNRKSSALKLANLLATVALSSAVTMAEDVTPVDTKASMRNIFTSYRELQGYLVKSDRFFDPANSEQIQKLLSEIRTGFHSAENLDKKYTQQPGFLTNISIMTDTLKQVSKDMETSPTDYDLLRLRAISQNCFSCHSSYKPESSFEATIPPEIDKDLLAKANYLAATRQFEAARKAYIEAAQSAEGEKSPVQPLRQWLVLETRIYDEPSSAITELERFIKTRKKLREFERGEIQSWIDGLHRWKRDAIALPPVKKAEFLLRQTISSPEPAYARTPEVEVLRASGILHRAFADNSITSKDRGQALYILGLSYSKLPLFFPDELPEFYLEACVRENPNTTVARSAYNLFKEIITLGYTGSGGTHIPGDILAKIDELYRVAHGIPDINERV